MLSPAALSAIAAPRRIAVVGASRDPQKLSGKPIRYLSTFGYAGEIVPITRGAAVVQGYPARSSLEPDDDIDLAIVAVPADEVAEALSMCVRAGVRVAVVFAGGFGELGERGSANQATLAGVAGIGPGGMRVFGPNCLGFVRGATGVTATFGSVLDEFDLLEGDTALLTQSGGFGSAVLGAANAAGVGCSWWVSTGNEFDISLSEMMEALVEQDDVARLLVCTEGIKDGVAFVRGTRRARELGKPIVMLKAARSALGARVAASHTGALANSNTVFEGIARQLGIITVRSLEQLLDVGRGLVLHPQGSDGPATIVTVSGGAGVIAVDASVDHELELADWPAEWQQRMAAGLPLQASVGNPMDVTATTGADALGHALRTAVAHPGTGAVVALLANRRQDERSRSDLLVEVQRSSEKPIVVSWTGSSDVLPVSLADRGVASYSDPTRAIVVASALARIGGILHAHDVITETHEPHGTAASMTWVERADGSRLLDDESSRALLSRYGIETPLEVEVVNEREALEAARNLGYPVVLKARSTEVLHRSSAGLVRADLGDEARVRAAWQDLKIALARVPMGVGTVVVQEQIPRGVELLVGATTDRTFGTTMVVASGGLSTELIGDATTFLPPVSESYAESLLRGLRAVQVMGHGRNVNDTTRSAARTVSRISWMIADNGRLLREVDFNPLIVTVSSDGDPRCVAVDWLLLGNPSVV
jgi:acetate---CoA ligase (ADP-forming)